MKKTCRYLSACTLILCTGLFLVGCNSSDVASVDKAAPYNEKLNSDYNLTVQNDALGSERNLTGNLVVDHSQIENRFDFTTASYFEQNLMWGTTISDIDINVYSTDEVEFSSP